MYERIGEFIELNPLISGLIFIIVGMILLFYRLEKKNTFVMKDYGLISWRLLVQTWGLIIMLILCGLIIIFTNI
jgi:hypothetical protein|tara:strand:- start:817 stop:1038 length:222 start_codon:yes stop_codon:yes gene_type:complete